MSQTDSGCSVKMHNCGHGRSPTCTSYCYRGLLHPTAEFAARFMIIAMAITPLRMLFPKARRPVWMVRRRRHFGVAAFRYAVLHTVLYIVDMQT